MEVYSPWQKNTGKSVHGPRVSLGKTAPKRHRGSTSGISLTQTGIERGTQMGPTGRGMSPSEVTDSKTDILFIGRKI